MARLSGVDAKVVRDASRGALLGYAEAAVENSRTLLDDAEMLLAGDRHARAYAMAVLSVEESGKATGLLALALMPDDHRARMSLRSLAKLLEQHKLKQLGGILIAAVQWGRPGMSARLAATPVDELAELLNGMQTQADVTDYMKLRGLYADMARDGSVSRPSSITKAEAIEQVRRARDVVATASSLTDQKLMAVFANPPAEAMTISSVVFDTYINASSIDTASDAATVIHEVLGAARVHLGGKLPGEA